MADRPTKKRTCAPPVSFRAMPENEIPPAMRVDIYCFSFFLICVYATHVGIVIKYAKVNLIAKAGSCAVIVNLEIT